MHTEAHESAGTDSFLDVTVNIVGILIILVMAVGMRVKNGPATGTEQTQATQEELTKLARNAAEIEQDARRAEQEITRIQQEIELQSAQRVAVATAIAAAEKNIADKRAQLNGSQQEDFDLRRQSDEARVAVEREKAELADLQSKPAPVEEIKHYPTPLSKTVLGHELHFQLQGGRVAYVPVDDFVDDVRSNMRSSVGNLNEVTDKVGVVGPRNGFEMRYTVDLITDRSRGVVGMRTREWQLVPVGMEMGEPIDKALSSQSQFRFALASHSPRETTVTLWTYPDSFAEYGRVKEELHRLGYATAGRPLPKGVLIGGSDHGTKSSAQ
jgi:Ezrin/radixin/moesin family